MTTIEKQCPRCGQTNTLEVKTLGFEMWQKGSFIQDALPELTPSQREILQTGIDAKCWEEIFQGDEL
jgi:hypothetical protein